MAGALGRAGGEVSAGSGRGAFSRFEGTAASSSQIHSSPPPLTVGGRGRRSSSQRAAGGVGWVRWKPLAGWSGHRSGDAAFLPGGAAEDPSLPPQTILPSESSKSSGLGGDGVIRVVCSLETPPGVGRSGGVGSGCGAAGGVEVRAAAVCHKFLQAASSTLASLAQACTAISQGAVFRVPGWKGDRDPFPSAGGTSLTLDARFPFVMAAPVFYVFIALLGPGVGSCISDCPSWLSLLAWVPEGGGVVAGKVCFRLV